MAQEQHFCDFSLCCLPSTLLSTTLWEIRDAELLNSSLSSFKTCTIIAEGQKIACGKLERMGGTCLGRGAGTLKDCSVAKSERVGTGEASLLPPPLPPTGAHQLKA